MNVLAFLFSEADFTGASRTDQTSFGPSSSTVPTMRESWDLAGTSPGARRSLSTPTADIWVSFNLLTTSADPYDINAQDNLINLRANGEPVFRFAIDNDVGGKQYSAQIWDGSAFQTVGTPFVIGDLTRTRFDIHMVISDTVGVFDVFTDRVNLSSSFSGDTALTAATTFDEIFSAPALTAGQRVSGLYVFDDDTRDTDTIQVRLSGDGNISEFTGASTAIEHGNATNITPFNDATFIESTVLGRTSLYATDAITGFDSHEVLAIATSARAQSETLNNAGLSIIERHQATDTVAPAQTMTAAEFGVLQHVFYPDDGMGGLLTVAGLGPIEIGVRNGT